MAAFILDPYPWKSELADTARQDRSAVKVHRFPYQQSKSNCLTCHRTTLKEVLPIPSRGWE
jgi:hypothetical protein